MAALVWLDRMDGWMDGWMGGRWLGMTGLA